MDSLTPEMQSSLMSLALEEAVRAEVEQEVPIGAVVCLVDEASRITVLGRGHNRVEQRREATAHAEILAIQEASGALQNWRLTGAILVSTLEPCVMCLGAIRLARMRAIVFGAGDSRFGALGSVYTLAADDASGAAPSVFGGVMREECSSILKRFFERRRHSP